MSISKFFLVFIVLSMSAWAQTLTIIAGDGQLAHLETGLGGNPITFQLTNGATPVANATILLSNPGGTFLPLSASSVVTNAAGQGTVQFEPAFLGNSPDETYKLLATSGSASLTFYEAASDSPVLVSISTSAPNKIYPLIGTAGTPATFHFTTQLTQGIANVSTRIVPVEKGTPPPGIVVETAYCLEGAALPEQAVYSNAGGTAVCTPVFNVPNTALNPAYDTFEFEVVVGDISVFGPYNYSITAVPLAASVSSNMILGQTNAPLSIPITVTGGTPPYTFTVLGVLPAGLAISSTGVISGTPSATGSYTFSVEVADHTGASKTVGPLTVGVSGGNIQVTPTSLPTAVVGMPYSVTLSAVGGIPPYTWALSTALPTGLIATSSGSSLVISGTPTVVSTISLAFLITDSFGEKLLVPTQYTLAVLNPLGTTTTSFPEATVGTAYSTGISVSGGTAPYTYKSSALPAGLVLNTNGTITGTPTTAGVTNVTVTITDSVGAIATFTAPLEVSGGAFAYPAKVSLPIGVVGQAYSYQLPAPTGGVPAYTFAFAAGSTPNGLTLSPTGLLTGIPPSVGSQTLNITVTDSASETVSVALTLTVNSTLPSVLSLTNAGSFLADPPSPGELVSLFGTGLGPATGSGFTLNTSGAVPTTLAGVQVSVGGIPAPILYASSTQVNLVIPFGVEPGANVPVSVSYNGNTSSTFTQFIGATDPSIFLIGTTQGAILNSDFSVNGPSNPAAPGSFIQIYGTGAGAFTPALTDGELATAPSDPSIPLTYVSIGGLQGQVLYAGAAPGEVAGVYQINVIIPSTVSPGSAVPLIVAINGNVSKQIVTVAVK